MNTLLHLCECILLVENDHELNFHKHPSVCIIALVLFSEDGGSYTCTATNMLGTIGTTGTLQVPGERRSVRI